MRTMLGKVVLGGIVIAAAASAAGAEPAPVAFLPSSLAALGDSLTTAYQTEGAPADEPANSWSTGTSPDVRSHYLRLLALNPSIQGRAYNLARPGSGVAGLLEQADGAVARRPDYVTIAIGTNDVCAPVGGEVSTAAFAAVLRTVLTRLSDGLPRARVLVASIPDWPSLWQRLHDDPAAERAWRAFPGRCPPLLDGGPAGRADVAGRIDALNGAIREVCAVVPRCSDDGGAAFRLWRELEPRDLAVDRFHLSRRGQARLAAVTWAAGPFAAS
jgi:lysophospholipase L1-like esterase